MGRYAVKKVDEKGKPIKNFKVWKSLNPDSLYFDSKLEYNFWIELKRRNINFVLQKTYLLQESFNFKEWCIRKVKGVATLGWHNCRIQPITWTPDFLLPDYNLVIEAKGKPNDAFPNKLKMFKYMVKVENLNLVVVVLHSLKELNEFLDNGLIND